MFGYVYVYEKELFLKFESGRLVATREVINDLKDLEDDCDADDLWDI